jgi:outer membrane lipoprotein-sorting protein
MLLGQNEDVKGRTSEMHSRLLAARRTSVACFCVLFLGATIASGQQLDPATVIRRVDAAVLERYKSIAGYTVTEHYAMYRGKDETHPVSEMTVKTTYRKDVGKSYAVVSEGGSAMIRRLGLDPILESERNINLPGNVERSWITSANYQMTLKTPTPQQLDGRNCLVIAINPRRQAPNLIVGAIWVDANDYTIVRLEGIASKAPTVFAGATHMMRQYANVNGFSMATRARAESNTFLYGKAVVTIEYSNYDIQVRSAK